MFASLLTSSLFRTTLPFAARNGITWCLTKHRTSRISRVKDGRHCFASIPSEDYYWLVLLFRTTWWSSGHSCTSWCHKSSVISKTLKSGSQILSVKALKRISHWILESCRSFNRFSDLSCCEEWNEMLRSSCLRKSSILYSAIWVVVNVYCTTSTSTMTRQKTLLLTPTFSQSWTSWCSCVKFATIQTCLRQERLSHLSLWQTRSRSPAQASSSKTWSLTRSTWSQWQALIRRAWTSIYLSSKAWTHGTRKPIKSYFRVNRFLKLSVKISNQVQTLLVHTCEYRDHLLMAWPMHQRFTRTAMP